MQKRSFYYEQAGKKRIIDRVSKRVARKLHAQKREVLYAPCNVNPQSTIGTCFVSSVDTEKDFDKFVNRAEYYNCGKQLGYYLAFYVYR